MHYEALGERFDIHGGGRDLIFPHHENELTQSMAHNGLSPATYWIHRRDLKPNNEMNPSYYFE